MKPRQAAILRALGHMPEPEPELTPEPPRDEAGRFAAKKPLGFEGGARQPVPLPVTPEQAERDHSALVVELLASRHVQRSSGGWSVRE